MSPPGFLVIYVLGFLGSSLTKGQVIDTSICVPVANVSGKMTVVMMGFIYDEV